MPTAPAEAALFASTRWTLVLAAAATAVDGDPRASQALAELCRIYWRPLYLFLRRQGIQSEDAQDLTQSFFVELIESQACVRADRTKGRFRSFLLGALKHFVADTRDRARTQKRGGGASFAPLDDKGLAEAEAQVARANRFAWSGERIFEREWALSLLHRTFRRLEEEYALAGKRSLFGALRSHLTLPGNASATTTTEIATVESYKALAQKLGRPAVTLRSDVARLRARFRAILREEVRDTIERADDVDEELKYLCAVLAAE